MWQIDIYIVIHFSRLKSLEMKKVFATLRALVEVMEALSKDAAPDGVGPLIKEEVTSAYNIKFCTAFSSIISPNLRITFSLLSVTLSFKL